MNEAFLDISPIVGIPVRIQYVSKRKAVFHLLQVVDRFFPTGSGPLGRLSLLDGKQPI